MIGTDRKLFEEGSVVRARMIRYAEYVGELHIIVFTQKNPKSEIRNPKIQIGENVFVYGTESRNRWWYILDGIRIGEKILRTAISDWVITTQDTAETGLVGWRLKSLFGIPLQLQIHTDVFSPYYTQSSLLNRIRVYFAKFLLPRADCVRVVSERIKKSLLARDVPEHKIAVLPIYIKNPKFEIRNPKKEKEFGTTILMVDRLEKEKDVITGIRALAVTIEKHTNVGLVIVGEGSLRGELEREVVKLDIQHSVRFVGWVDDVSEYYNQADIFLHTSLYEGYGLALVEAAMHGLPIVSTDVGIVGDLLLSKESALVCAPGDVLCIAQHITQLIESLELRGVYSSFAQKALTRGFRMTEEQYYEQYVALWRACLETIQ